MRNRPEKCPGCGLTNFRDAAECQWCALALSGRARNEYVNDAPAGPGRPWGLMLMLFALLVAGGGLVWHVRQKAAERAELAAEAAEADGAADSAESPKRAGPPSLSGRGPSDPPPFEATVEEWMKKNRENAEKNAELHRQMNRALYNVPARDIRDRRNTREVEPGQRPEEEAPPPPAPDDPE